MRIDNEDIALPDIAATLRRNRLEVEFQKKLIQNLRRDRSDLIEALFDWQNFHNAAKCDACFGEYRPRWEEPCEECFGTGYDWNERLSVSDQGHARIRQLESEKKALLETVAELQAAVLGVE